MKFKTILSSLILAVAVIVAQYLNYKIESKVSLTYNSTYEFVWCSIIMLVLGLIAGINIIWILHSENTIETIIAIAFQVIAAVVGFEALKIITFVPLMIIGVYICMVMVTGINDNCVAEFVVAFEFVTVCFMNMTMHKIFWFIFCHNFLKHTETCMRQIFSIINSLGR